MIDYKSRGMLFKTRHVLISLSLVTVVTLVMMAACMDASPRTGSQSDGTYGASDETADDDSASEGIVATCNPPPEINKGALYRVPIDGGTPPIKLVGDLAMPWGVSENNGILYFTGYSTEGSTGTIKMLSSTAVLGTTPDVLVSGLECPAAPLIIHQGFLYFIDQGGSGSINRVNLDTRVRTVLLEGTAVAVGMDISSAEDDVWIYFSEIGDGTNGAVKRFRVESNGSATGLETLAEDLKMPIGLKVDSYYIYIVEMNEGRLFRMAKDFGGASMPAQEDLMTGLSTPYPVALEDPTPDDPNDRKSVLYFADFNAADTNAGKIYKLSGIDISSPVTAVTPNNCRMDAALSCVALADSLSWPMVTMADESNVYWSEIWSASVKGVAKDGSSDAPFELANGIEHGFVKPHGIALDGVNVYFTDLGDNPCCTPLPLLLL